MEEPNKPALRMYAQGAYVPPRCRPIAAQETAENEVTPTPSYVIKNQINVTTVLDIVSFQSGIHNHPDKTKTPRVMLERLTPGQLLGARRSSSVSPTRRSSSAPPARRPKKEEAIVSPDASPSRTRRFHSATARTLPAPQPAASAYQKYNNKQKPKLKSAITIRKKSIRRQKQKLNEEGAISKKIKELNLRSREMKHVFKNVKNKNRQSDPDANKPSKKLSKKKFIRKSPNAIPIPAQSFCINTSENTDNLDFNDDLMGNIPRSSRKSSGTTTAKRNLYDYLIKLFDWPGTTPNVDLQDGHDEEINLNPTESIEQVNEPNQNVVIDKALNEFQKVPASPDMSHASSFPTALVVSETANIGPDENELRTTCITWHHKKLSATENDRYAVTKFCGKCLRCKAMFKCLKQDTLPIDVLADSKTIEDAHDSFQETLTNIAKEKYDYANLRSLLTDKGRNIMKAAFLLNKSDTSTYFSGMERFMLEKVIAILISGNLASDNSLTDNNNDGDAKRIDTMPPLFLSDNLFMQTPQRQVSPLPNLPGLPHNLENLRYCRERLLIAKTNNESTTKIVLQQTNTELNLLLCTEFHHLQHMAFRWTALTLTKPINSQSFTFLRCVVLNYSQLMMVKRTEQTPQVSSQCLPTSATDSVCKEHQSNHAASILGTKQ